VSIRPGPGILNRAVKGYRQETPNAEGMNRCLADVHLFTEADASTNADGIAASLEDACRAGMLQRKPFRRDHEPVPWWNFEIATLRRTISEPEELFNGQEGRTGSRLHMPH